MRRIISTEKGRRCEREEKGETGERDTGEREVQMRGGTSMLQGARVRTCNRVVVVYLLVVKALPIVCVLTCAIRTVPLMSSRCLAWVGRLL